MYLPSYIRIERGSDGSHDFKYTKLPLFARKPGNINTSMSAAPRLALVSASRYYCDVTWSYHNVCAKFHKDLKRFRWGPMTPNIQGDSVFARKPWNINTSMSAAPKLALGPASRYYCDVTLLFHNACAKFH